MVGDDAGTGTGMGWGKPCSKVLHTDALIPGVAHIKALCDPVHVTLAVTAAAVTAKKE
jgi:hypothetical protein